MQVLFQSALVAFAAGGLFLESALLLGVSAEFKKCLIVMGAVFGAYYAAPWMQQFANRFTLSNFERKRSRMFGSILLGCVFASLILVPNMFFISLVCLALYWAYQVGSPFLSEPIRNHTWSKPIVISIVWTLWISTFLIGSKGLWVFSIIPAMVFGSLFVFILAMSLLCDIADLETDRRMGVKTLPVVQNPGTIAYAACIIGMLPSLLFLSPVGLGSAMMVTTASCVFFSLVATVGVLKLPSYQSRILVDVLLLMKPFVLILVSI